VRAWVIPTLIIILIEYVAALSIGAAVGFNYSIPFVTFAVLGLFIGGSCIAAAIVTLLGLYAWQGEPRPARRLLAYRPRFTSFFLGVVFVTAQMGVLMWLKIMLPIATPFWADPLLAALDHRLFGVDPWRLTHDLFGWASPLIDRAYVTWTPAKFATLALVLAFPEGRRKTQAIIAYFLMVSTAALGQYLLSSGGPVFYQMLGLGDRFADLPIEPWVETTRAYLWSDYLRSGGKIGGGISAMPSLHVAVSLWIALVVRSYVPKASLVGWTYFGLIFVGSIHLGWHYALDSIAAVVLALLAWAVACWIASRSWRSLPAAEPMAAQPSLARGVSPQA